MKKTILDKIKDFTRSCEYDLIQKKHNMGTSQKNKWKIQGKLDLIRDLNHYLKELWPLKKEY